MAKKSILLILVTVGAVFLAVPGFTATPPHKLSLIHISEPTRPY